MKGRSVSWHSVSPFYSFAKFVLQVLTQYRDTRSKKRTTSPSLALSFTTWGFQVLTQYLPTWWSWEMHLMVLRDVLDGPERCTWWPWKMYSMVLRDALDGLERCTWWSWVRFSKSWHNIYRGAGGWARQRDCSTERARDTDAAAHRDDHRKAQDTPGFEVL